MEKMSLRMVCGIAALAFCTCSLHQACAESPLITHVKSDPAQSPAGAKADQERFRTAIIRIAKDSIPAVVHIEVTESQVVESPSLPFEGDPFLRQFFNIPKIPKRLRKELKGIGTGMIINDRGFILTNYHVVEGATQIQVALSDGREFPGRVIGTDPKTDLSVIKIDAETKLPYVTFGDSDKVQVGEWVVAIGQPQGLNESVTQGIISAMHRQGIMDPNTYQDFLQTDAAINPGNSGGPLINLDGKVIGVTSIIASQSGGFEGIGFAIPSNTAVHIANALMTTGKIVRGWAGMTVQDIGYQDMKKYGLSSTKGALVRGIIKEGPAEKAGIKPGDVIVSFSGKEVPDSGMLRNLTAGTRVGKNVSVGIIRNGKRQTLTLRVGNLEDAARMMAAQVRERLGADFRPLNASERETYGLDEGLGVAITSIDPKGPLGKQEFETGDIILMIDNEPIEGMEQFASIMTGLKPGQSVTLTAIDHKSRQAGHVRVNVR